MRSAKRVEDKMPDALQFEALRGKPGDGWVNTDLFAIPGHPGIWRRIARTSQSKKIKRKDAELAIFGGSIVELVRDVAIEHEVQCAGFSYGNPASQIVYLEEHGAALPAAAPTAGDRPDQPPIPDLAEEPAEQPVGQQTGQTETAEVKEDLDLADTETPPAEEPAPAPAPRGRRRAAAS